MYFYWKKKICKKELLKLPHFFCFVFLSTQRSYWLFSHIIAFVRNKSHIIPSSISISIQSSRFFSLLLAIDVGIGEISLLCTFTFTGSLFQFQKEKNNTVAFFHAFESEKEERKLALIYLCARVKKMSIVFYRKKKFSQGSSSFTFVNKSIIFQLFFSLSYRQFLWTTQTNRVQLRVTLNFFPSFFQSFIFNWSTFLLWC